MTSETPDRRKTPRQKAFLAGKLYFNNRMQVADCMIRDISDRGARLVYSDTVTIPDDVELYIPQKDQTLNARIKWRRGREMGATFITAAEVNGPLQSDEIARRFAQLEAEVANLKRIIKKLTGPETEVA